MKKTSSLLLSIGIMFLYSSTYAQNWWQGAIRGEGDVVTKSLNLEEFDGITLAFSGDVYITQGKTQSVQIEAQQNIIDNIVTVVEGRHWKIRYDKPVRYTKGVKVYITMTDLTKAYISGSGNIVGKNKFTGLDDVRFGVSGSGNIDVDVEAKGMIDSQISGSGNIQVDGKADSIGVEISGSGNVRAYGLEVYKGMVQISGSGDAEVNVTNDLEIKISGSGDVTYKGKPSLRSKVSGSGDVNSY